MVEAIGDRWCLRYWKKIPVPCMGTIGAQSQKFEKVKKLTLFKWLFFILLIFWTLLESSRVKRMLRGRFWCLVCVNWTIYCWVIPVWLWFLGFGLSEAQNVLSTISGCKKDFQFEPAVMAGQPKRNDVAFLPFSWKLLTISSGIIFLFVFFLAELTLNLFTVHMTLKIFHHHFSAGSTSHTEALICWQSADSSWESKDQSQQDGQSCPPHLKRK